MGVATGDSVADMVETGQRVKLLFGHKRNFNLSASQSRGRLFWFRLYISDRVNYGSRETYTMQVSPRSGTVGPGRVDVQNGTAHTFIYHR